MSLLIGLLGRAGSGKSTAARHLAEKYGAARLALATPLKELAKRMYEFTDEQVFGTQAQKEAVDPRWGISPREAMIRLGDGARHVLGRDVWTDACFRTAGWLRDQGVKLIVVEDVRYPNEAEKIQGWLPRTPSRDLGVVIKLVCPDGVSLVDVNAPSERSVDEVPSSSVDYLIESRVSPGSVDLLSKLDAIVKPLIDRLGGPGL